MMLNVLKTNTSLEGGKRIISMLEKHSKEDSHHFVIVPDRFTLSFEQEICNKVFFDGCINVDVVSFTRLAVKLIGNKLNKCLSKEGTVILLNKIIMQLSDQLNYYKDLKSYSFAKELFAAIASLRDSKISYEDILVSLDKVTGVTKEKLADIALIYNSYAEELAKKYVDTVSRIDYLIDRVKDLDIFKASHVYIYGFNIYSAQQVCLIKELIKYTKSVTIAYAGDSGGNNHELFIKGQIAELISFCNENKIKYNEEESIEHLNKPFSLLHKNLFGYAKNALSLDSESHNKVVLYAEDNPYEEIRGVAKEINYLVKNCNYRYKDIAVVINDENYIKIVKEIFTRCDIPFFADVKYYVRDSFAVKYINWLLEAVEENYAVDRIFKLAHNPLIGFTRQEIESFENYVLKYNVNFSAFLQPITGDDKAEYVRDKLAKLMLKVPKRDNKVCQYVKFIIEELSQESIVEKLNEFIKSDDIELSKCSEVNDFLNVIKEIDELGGDNVVTLSEFINIINSAIADMGKGALPQYIDSVFVGNTSDSRFSDIKALFVVGASSGNFPKTSGDNVIISSFDNEVMKKGGLLLSPTPLDNNNMERLVVADLIVKPREKLYVGYSKSNIKGEDLLVGEALAELMHLMGVEKLSKLVENHNFNDADLLLYNLINSKNTYYEYIRNKVPEKFADSVKDYLIKKGYGARLEFCPNSQEFVDFAQYLFKKNGDMYNTSVSQLESYFKCPYYHFLKYGLKLKEREEGMIKVNMVGDIVHKILEIYFKEYKDSIKMANAQQTAERIDKVINDVVSSPDYDMYRAENIGRYTLNNLKEEGKKLLNALTDYVKQSRFTPTYIELGFGRNEKEKGIKIEASGNIFNFTGKVDRVDTYGDKVAIIDYKTGSVEEDLKYVYFGKKLQLYIYLKVFLNEGKTPAGVFYMPIKANYNKEGSSYKLVGQILSDLATFAELDTNCIVNEPYQSNMLDFSVTCKKDNYQIKGKNAIAREDFETVCNYAVEISKIALEEIAEGFRDKKPFLSSCEFCPYKRMCGEVEERKGTGVGGINSFKTLEEDNYEQA